jgi:thiol-disulfide isomerase/thioredoxin
MFVAFLSCAEPFYFPKPLFLLRDFPISHSNPSMKYPFLITLCLLTVSSLAHSVQEGQQVPQCEAALSGNGAALDFSAYKGKVVLVDFWATWCPPCRKSMPFFNQLRNEHLKDGFEIIAINVDEVSADAKQFLNENPVDYIMAFDPGGSNCPRKFDVKAMPSSYLVDKIGKVRKVHLGFRDADQAVLRGQVSELLAE